MNSQQQTQLHSDEEASAVTAYLHDLYTGVFTPDGIRAHLDNHVGFAFADYAVSVLRTHAPAGSRVLDIGAGFGSFVIAARRAGFDARGVEIADFEVDFARRRLRRERPTDDPDSVFTCGDATRLDAAAARFDAVTFWNVLEHIEDSARMLATADVLLAPGGLLFVLCPNYAARRDEAHYHVPWLPELRHDRTRAARYLRDLGRDPRYFETSIFCRTNWEVIGQLRDLGYTLYDLGDPVPRRPTLRLLREPVRELRRLLDFYHPHRPSVGIVARKPGRGKV